MYTLLIETSTEQGLLAILKDQHIVFQGNLGLGHQNSTHLLPEIERGLKSLQITMQDFHFVAVGMGPGSYTGIRIGVITAKTLAYAANLPLIGLCTLELWQPKQKGSFAVLVDAKIGGAYVLVGEKSEEKVSYVTTAKICELDRLFEVIAPITTILTPQSQVLRQKLQTLYPHHSWVWQESGPSPQRMEALASAKFYKGDYSLDREIEIMYLRRTQAEIEQDLKKSTS